MVLVLGFTAFGALKLITAPNDRYFELKHVVDQSELKVYESVESLGMLPIHISKRLEMLSTQVDADRAQADRIWQSIPGGTLVERNHVPVGENVKVRDLMVKATRNEEKLYEEKRIAGRSIGRCLIGTEHAAVWDLLQNADKALSEFHDRNWQLKHERLVGNLVVLGSLLAMVCFFRILYKYFI